MDHKTTFQIRRTSQKNYQGVIPNRHPQINKLAYQTNLKEELVFLFNHLYLYQGRQGRQPTYPNNQQFQTKIVRHEPSTTDNTPVNKPKQPEQDDKLKMENQELKFQLQQRDAIIKQKDDEIKKLKREIQGLKIQMTKRNEPQQQQQQQHHEEQQIDLANPDARSILLALKMQQREQQALQAMQYYQFMQEAMAPQQIDDPNYVNTDNMTYEQLLELEEKIGYVNRGLNKEQIKQIQKHKITFLNKMNLPENCSVCFSEFRVDEKYRKLKCSHVYHSKCIKQWLQNEKKCPICKIEIVI